MKTFNINSCVYVKLTTYGKSILIDYFNYKAPSIRDFSGDKNIPVFHIESIEHNGYVKIPMCQLFEIFGSECKYGTESMFKSRILIDEKEITNADQDPRCKDCELQHCIYGRYGSYCTEWK